MKPAAPGAKMGNSKVRNSRVPLDIKAPDVGPPVVDIPDVHVSDESASEVGAPGTKVGTSGPRGTASHRDTSSPEKKEKSSRGQACPKCGGPLAHAQAESATGERGVVKCTRCGYFFVVRG